MKTSLLDRLVATLFTKNQSTKRRHVSRFLTGAALTTLLCFGATLPAQTIEIGDGQTVVYGTDVPVGTDFSKFEFTAGAGSGTPGTLKFLTGSWTFDGQDIASDNPPQRLVVADGKAGKIVLEDDARLLFSGSHYEVIGYSATAYGGVIRLESGATFAFQGGGPNNGAELIFSHNTAYGNGDGANSGYGYGGAIDGGGDFSNIQTLTFSHNTASGISSRSGFGFGDGGAIFGGGDFSNIQTLTFSHNTASGSGYGYTSGFGGAIYGGGDFSNIQTLTFSHNTASGIISGSGDGSGGAIYASNETVKFETDGDITFSGNRAVGTSHAYGGAIDMRNTGSSTTSTLEMDVADGKTFLFTGNTTKVGSDDAKANSIHLEASVGTTEMTVNTQGTGLMDMRDPMTGYSRAEISVVKSGTGTWKLGGENVFTRSGTGKTTFAVNGGTLYLYRSGEVANGNAENIAAMVDTGSIQLDGTGSSFTLEDGATLSLGGVGHEITTDGTITFETDSTLAFDLTEAIAQGQAGATTSLTLDGTTVTGNPSKVDIRAFNGDGTNQTFNLATKSSGTWVVTTTAPAFTTHGELVTNTRADGSASLSGNGTDTLQLSSSVENGIVNWKKSDGVWNATSENWDTSQIVGKETDQRFLHGDAVVFGKSGFPETGTVTIQEKGVTIAARGTNPGMEIASGDWTFTGGEIEGGEIRFTGDATATFKGVNNTDTRRMNQRITVAADKEATIKLADDTRLLFSGSHDEVIGYSVTAYGGVIRLESGATFAFQGTGQQENGAELIFSHNTASGDGGIGTGTGTGSGGAISGGGGDFSNIQTLTFSHNTASGSGGASNSGSGGAISGRGDFSNIQTLTFSHNTASGSGSGYGYGYGGAIDASNKTVKFETGGDVTFSGNRAVGTNEASGGAIDMRNASSSTTSTLEMNVADGKTFLFTGNTTKVGSNDAKANSIHLRANFGTTEMTVNTQGTGLMDIRDPMTGRAGDNITIEKTGDGTWKLGGENVFTRSGTGKTTFAVNEGTLYLYRSGEVANGNAENIAAMVDTGSIQLDGTDSSFTLGANATLSLGGVDHKITTDGTITLDSGSTLAFDMTDAANDGTTTNLTLDATAGFTGTAGSQTIDILAASALADGTYNLVNTGNATRVATTGTVLFNGNNSAQDRSVTRYTLVHDGTGILQVSAGAMTAKNLTWTNGDSVVANQGKWGNFVDADSPHNWTDNPGGTATITQFNTGDSVIFGPTGSNKNVTVDSAGVDVADMTVSDAYNFSGGQIRATGTVDVTGTLGLVVGSNPALTAGSVDFNTTGKLNITGYTPDETENPFDGSANRQTVIQTTGGIANFNPLVTVAGQATADFLSAKAFLEGNDVKVETSLTWYSTDPTRLAHGDFTVDSGTFTLGAILSDNSASTNRRNDWNGNSLTKLGDGTLTLSGANTHSGGNTISDGRLVAVGQAALGSGTTTNNAELELNITGRENYRTDIDNTGGKLIKSGTGDLVVDLDAGQSVVAQNLEYRDGNIVAMKNDATGIEKGESNAKRFVLLEGAGAEGFLGHTLFDSSLSRIKYSLDSSVSNELAYLLWLQYAYQEDYGSRLSRNGYRMAGLVDNLPSGNGFLTALDSLADDAQILSGIENATGEGYAMSMDGGVKLQRTFNDFLLARKTFQGGDQKRVILGQCDPCGPVCGSRSSYELWGQFTGGSHDRSSIGRYSGYDLSNYGVAFGVERKISSRWFGGVAFGYDNANLKLDDRHAKDEFEAFRASLYGGYAGRNWYASGYAGYSKNWHDMKRNNPVLGFSNRGKYDDDVFSTGLELGKVLKMRNGMQFIPSIGIHWIHLDSPAFTERGSMESALRLSKSHYDSVRLPIGARLNRTFTSRSIAWTPEVRAFYVAELADTRAGLNTAFASSMGSGSVFADSGSSGRSGGQFGTGVTAQLTTRLSVGIDYDYEVWEHYDRHNLTGNVTVRW